MRVRIYRGRLLLGKFEKVLEPSFDSRHDNKDKSDDKKQNCNYDEWCEIA